MKHMPNVQNAAKSDIFKSALDLMQFLYRLPKKSASRLGTDLPPKQTLRLVQSSFSANYWVEAILRTARYLL